jgi:hypothetical protein
MICVFYVVPKVAGGGRRPITPKGDFVHRLNWNVGDTSDVITIPIFTYNHQPLGSYNLLVGHLLKYFHSPIFGEYNHRKYIYLVNTITE